MKKIQFLFDVNKTFSQISEICSNEDLNDLKTVVDHARSIACDHLRSSVNSYVDGLSEPSSDDKSEV